MRLARDRRRRDRYHCHVVNDAAIAAAVDAGARTLGQVCRSDRGGQRLRLVRVLGAMPLVCEHVSRQVPESVEAQHAAS